MSSMFSKILNAQQCKDCRIVKHERYNSVHTCEPCKKRMEDEEKALCAMSLDDFIKEVVNGRACVDDADNHSYALYEKYMDEMPYGTAKARDGDPSEWITERLYNEYSHLIEEEETA